MLFTQDEAAGVGIGQVPYQRWSSGVIGGGTGSSGIWNSSGSRPALSRCNFPHKPIGQPLASRGTSSRGTWLSGSRTIRFPSRWIRTSVPGMRNSLGRRTAWLRPREKSLAVVWRSFLVAVGVCGRCFLASNVRVGALIGFAVFFTDRACEVLA